MPLSLWRCCLRLLSVLASSSSATSAGFDFLFTAWYWATYFSFNLFPHIISHYDTGCFVVVILPSLAIARYFAPNFPLKIFWTPIPRIGCKMLKSAGEKNPSSDWSPTPGLPYSSTKVKISKTTKFSCIYPVKWYTVCCSFEQVHHWGVWDCFACFSHIFDCFFFIVSTVFLHVFTEVFQASSDENQFCPGCLHAQAVACFQGEREWFEKSLGLATLKLGEPVSILFMQRWSFLRWTWSTLE